MMTSSATRTCTRNRRTAGNAVLSRPWSVWAPVSCSKREPRSQGTLTIELHHVGSVSALGMRQKLPRGGWCAYSGGDMSWEILPPDRRTNPHQPTSWSLTGMTSGCDYTAKEYPGAAYVTGARVTL
jgi:hypothetical protein